MPFPEETINSIAQYLPQGADSIPALPDEQQREYNVEELALAANTTVRNIRAYQDKGVLPPPSLRGRKGVYNNQHLSRLRLVSNLLERGYTLSSIRELLSAMEQGIGLSEVLGMESAINSPWGSEEPVNLPMSKMVAMFGTKLTPAAIRKASELELFSRNGAQLRVTSMNTLKASQELCATGIPLEELLANLETMRGKVQAIADSFVKLVTEHVLEPYGEQPLPPKEEFPEIAALVWRLRPLAQLVVDAELGRAMDQAANRFLADTLESILKQLPQD